MGRARPGHWGCCRNEAVHGVGVRPFNVASRLPGLSIYQWSRATCSCSSFASNRGSNQAIRNHKQADGNFRSGLLVQANCCQEREQHWQLAIVFASLHHLDCPEAPLSSSCYRARSREGSVKLCIVQAAAQSRCLSSSPDWQILLHNIPTNSSVYILLLRKFPI